MKWYEKKRLEADWRIDRLLSSRQGAATFREKVRRACEGDAMIGLLREALALPGDVIECGVYRGRSSTKIALQLAELAPEKHLYACDSYDGFPEEKVGRVDVGFLRRLGNLRKKFKMAGDTPERLRRIFSTFGAKGEPVIGYFSDTLPRLENRPLCFIHLDCDIYSSYKECLDRLYKNLVPGGIVVFDEYRSPKWPGAQRAVDEFFDSRDEKPEPHGDIWHVRKPIQVSAEEPQVEQFKFQRPEPRTRAADAHGFGRAA